MQKVVKPWLGPYIIQRKLGAVGVELKSEDGRRTTRVHVNRLRIVSPQIQETGKPEDGVFPDSLRLFSRISSCEHRTGDNGNDERWFRVRLLGEKNSRWVPETDLPEVVVALFDIQKPDACFVNNSGSDFVQCRNNVARSRNSFSPETERADMMMDIFGTNAVSYRE